jgi:predicted dehydrogenase
MIQEESVPVLRWGIMGTANIARKNARAMALSPAAQLVAVGSRTEARCATWVGEVESALQAEGLRAQSPPLGAVRCHGSYAALLADPNVDAVYLPLPTTLHLAWVLAAAAAGKHVLVEKPVGLTLAEVAQMAEACRAAKVLFMDGVMFHHHPRLAHVQAALADPCVHHTFSVNVCALCRGLV